MVRRRAKWRPGGREIGKAEPEKGPLTNTGWYQKREEGRKAADDERRPRRRKPDPVVCPDATSGYLVTSEGSDGRPHNKMTCSPGVTVGKSLVEGFWKPPRMKTS